MTQPLAPQDVTAKVTTLKADFEAVAAKHAKTGLLIGLWRKVTQYPGQAARKAEEYGRYATQMQETLGDLAAGRTEQAHTRVGELHSQIFFTSSGFSMQGIGLNAFVLKKDEKESKRKEGYIARLDEIAKALAPPKPA